ncbi:unnamed protein product [Larinioides sclopetarius]|uniref:Uncharacterized protein n=1 Tax=Larinioides sclopetarius TaxID=280406 RepID=A0AAV2A2Z5_9ARAC
MNLSYLNFFVFFILLIVLLILPSSDFLDVDGLKQLLEKLPFLKENASKDSS